MRHLPVLLTLFSLATFAQENAIKKTNYWTQGKAEVNVYELSQNRYKENHSGNVVSIFVTEDFLTEKQVKNEYWNCTLSNLWW